MNVIIVAGGCILLVNVLFCFFFYTQAKRKLSPDSILKNVRQEVNRLVKEIDSTADRDISILEQRIAELKILTEKAEQVTTQFESVTKNATENKYTTVLETEHEPPLAIQSIVQAENPAELPFDFVGGTPTATAHTVPSQVKASDVDSEIFAENVATLRESVVLYATQGFSRETIAEKLDISRGEVDLILSMAGI